uniref:ZP domain-containing protein n=1 Tax=Oreochromis niloticus TaxID=8128 RepID=A0A669CMI4_ORENI
MTSFHPSGYSQSVDPCYNYTILNDQWRSTNNTNTQDLHCDQSINWQGWYRLFLGSSDARIPERCIDTNRCGTHAPLWITQPHPTHCCQFPSHTIQVKLCHGNYYVYKLERPSMCHLAYCAVKMTSFHPSGYSQSVDPCYNYTILNDQWRSTNNTNTQDLHCDQSINWQGWCIDTNRCGTHAPLWITQPHPTQHGETVNRTVCNNWSGSCCQFPSHTIQVKLCHGNYYVYKLERPSMCHLAYCAGIMTSFHPSGYSQSVDPCYNYTILNDQWRSTNNTNTQDLHCDQSINWQGWYRLFLGSSDARIPERCIDTNRCGTHAPLWITQPHPTQHGETVNRTVCNNWSGSCCQFPSHTIQVKLCHGNYYVYKLERPSMCHLAYCAGYSQSVDPCYNYAVLNDQWRSTNNTNTQDLHCDQSINWQGWYRLFLGSSDARIPERCIDTNRCGTHAPLWITQPHPTQPGETVNRTVCNNWSGSCCYFSSHTIQVKLCHGNYYVYKLERPSVCHLAYCAEVNTTTSMTSFHPSGYSQSVDPCYNYTILNDEWRSTNNTNTQDLHCDQSINWQGWYRLFLGSSDARIPERCIDSNRCGTHAPLWITQPHPTQHGETVNRTVCNNWSGSCCQFPSHTIQVKLCHGNYYVYKLERPSVCHLAYCAGDPTVCMQDSASVTLVGCLLEDKGIDYSALHLNDPTCRGQVDEPTHMVTLSFNSSNSCGTEVTVSFNSSSLPSTTVESSTEVQLNQEIWVELKTDGLDGDMVVVVTDSCWATDQPSPDSTPRYDLIINGCANPADQTVQVKGNGLGTSNYFSFNMFEFTRGSGEVYLHCKLHLCPKQEYSCLPVQHSANTLAAFLNERICVDVLKSGLCLSLSLDLSCSCSQTQICQVQI